MGPIKAVKVGADGPYRKEIESLNAEAFSEAERSSYDDFMTGIGTGMADLLAFEDERGFLGFSYVVRWYDMLYIYYLAVEKGYRGQGIGTEVLDLLKETYSPVTVTLHMEYPDGSAEKERRLKFYTLNGFMETRVKEKWRGLDFELLYWGSPVSKGDMDTFHSDFSKARGRSGQSS